ncbi:MAG: MarC family protein [Candidatus Brocadiia bacterium]
MRDFWLCFVPLFVAVDALGILPIFLSMTEELEAERRRRALLQSVVTASAVALLFLAAGKLVLNFVGVTVPDFLVAGGALLFLISLSDLLGAQKERRWTDPDSLGAVPLGVPLIVGPAVLTTILVLVDQYGPWPTVLATLANMALAGGVFSLAEPINRVLGKAGSKTISKLASLLLAAIAVTMVRRGFVAIVSAGTA